MFELNIKNPLKRFFNAITPYSLEEQKAGEYEAALKKYAGNPIKSKFAIALIRNKYKKLESI